MFVPRTAPGDEVDVSLVVSKKRWARGLPARILTAGAGRTPPPCPHYHACGGCTLQHLTYEAQLDAKRGIVVEALRRLGGVRVSLEGVEPADRRFGYRSRATFHLMRLPGERVVAGFHRWDHPSRLADVTDCPVLVEPVERVWQALRSTWGPSARALPSGRLLRLTLREVDEGVVLTVEGGTGRGDADALLSSVPGLVAVWSDDGSGRPRLLGGDAQASATIGEDTYRLGSGAFLQVHRDMGTRLALRVTEALGPLGAEGRVIDAYAGAGLFARALARLGWRPVLVEADPAACRDARRAGLDVVEGRVEERLPALLPADALVVNPPRAGLATAVTDVLVERGPDRIVYVSCDPATLGRDLARLGPYRVVGLSALDLFPQTAHVETVVTLLRDTADELNPTSS